MKSIKLKEYFNASAEVLYEAWLDSKIHTKMTGAKAVCSSKVNGSFTAWDGYISGKNLSLVPNKKIVQAWRTTDFSENDDNSELTLEFEQESGGCFLVLTHKNIPDNQPDYKKGWVNYYFSPMKKFFR